VIGPEGISNAKSSSPTPVKSPIHDPLNTQTETGGIRYEDLEIKGKLGAGAFGSVTKVVNKNTNATYAMKKVTLEKSEQNKPKTIIAEFKALYECHSDNIIKMYDTFYRDGNIFMLIEYMDCGSLEDVIRYCKNIPESILSKMAAQILKGMMYLHEEKGIVHRDIKPAVRCPDLDMLTINRIF
jgi:serine/threonine protein kinase